MQIIPQILESRMEAHLTLVKLTEKLGIHKSHLSEIENGKH